MNVYWLEQRQADVPAEDGWLSAGEQARLNALRFAGRRADWRLGRWTAKRAAAACLGVPLTAIEVHASPSGAPEVSCGNQPAALTISISHRAGVAICTVAPTGLALGCDLEVVEPRSSAFLRDYFTAGERALVAHAAESEWPRLLALLWSAKESVLKALRVGLRVDTRSVVVSPRGALRQGGDGNAWHPLRARYAGAGVFHGWWRQTGDLLRTFAADLPTRPPTRL